MNYEMFFELFTLFDDLIKSFHEKFYVQRFKQKEWSFYVRFKYNLRLKASFRSVIGWNNWFIIESFGDLIWLWIWRCLKCWRFDGILKIVSERVFDIGINDGAETWLISCILIFDFDVFNLKYPSNDSKILEVVIIEVLIDSVIFAEIIGFF